MKFALSTNWCNTRLKTGEEIADLALALGFDELELGFRTKPEQVAGFRARLDQMPIGSIHAYCPVPISAPQGHPELYTLASFDAEARAIARFQVMQNIEFAADMGAATVVLHAGRVPFTTFWRRGLTTAALRQAYGRPRFAKLLARAKQTFAKRSAKLLPLFRRELELLLPTLEQHRVTLAFENLPYLEAFPNEEQVQSLVEFFRSPWIKGWFDTGHHEVRRNLNFLPSEFTVETAGMYQGMHLNDVHDMCDDHLPPGEGKVDFAALKPLAANVRHIVFEPHAGVDAANLIAGLSHIRTLWCEARR